MFPPFDPEVSAIFTQTLQQCEEELKAIQSEKAGLAEREAALLKQVRNLRELIAARNGSAAIVDAGSQMEILSTDLSGESKAETISRETAEILQGLGRPTHYAEIYEILKKKVALGGKSPAATLLSYLNKDARFERVDRGTYWLANTPTSTRPAATAQSPKRKTRRRRRRARRRRKSMS